MSTAKSNIYVLDSNPDQMAETKRFLKLGGTDFETWEFYSIHNFLSNPHNAENQIVVLDHQLTLSPEYGTLISHIRSKQIPLIVLYEQLPEKNEEEGIIQLQRNKITLVNLSTYVKNALQYKKLDVRLQEINSNIEKQNETVYHLLEHVNELVFVGTENGKLLYLNEAAGSWLQSPQSNSTIIEQLFTNHYEGKKKADLLFKQVEMKQVQWSQQKASLLLIHLNETNQQISNHQLPVDVFDQDFFPVCVIRNEEFLYKNETFNQLFLKSKSFQKQLLETYHIEFSSLGFHSNKKKINIKFEEAELKKFRTIHSSPVRQNGKNGHLWRFMPEQESDLGKLKMDDVIKITSHDLREPVRIISNYSKILKDGIGNPKDKQEKNEYLSYIHQSSSQLTKMLKDLRFYAGLEEHQPRLANVHLASLFQIVETSLNETFKDEKVIYVNKNYPEIFTDEVLFKEMLYQLLFNAFQFKKAEGNHQVMIACEKTTNEIILVIADTGKGVSQKYIQKVYEPFQKFNVPHGMGLGLTIVKLIADKLGINLRFESFQDVGTQVYLHMPIIEN